MLTERIRSILKEGEGLKVEFKKCRNSINKDVYDTVCAFLNRHGGVILLGVEDNGAVTGIDENHIEQIKKEFVTTINNPQKINPSVYLSMEQVEFDGKQIVYVYIPESSQVHRCSGKIYDRNAEFVIYSNNKPVIAEEDVFQIIIPLTRQATEQAAEQVTEQVTEQAERVAKILNYCKEPKTTSEIMNYLELTHREHFRSVILNPLIEKGLLFLTIPDKPNSPKQKYYSK